MRKLLRMLFVMGLMVLLFAVPAFAEEDMVQYSIEELGMSIDVPSDYVVFTKDMAEDDPVFSYYGISKSDLESVMAPEDYLYILNLKDNSGIQISMTEGDVKDFNLLSDETLAVLEENLESGYLQDDSGPATAEIYRHKQAKFFKIEAGGEDGSSHICKYYTAYNGQYITVLFLMQGEVFDSSRGNAIKEIVDSINFDTPPMTPETAPVYTPSYGYVYSDSGLKFNVPDNWTEIKTPESILRRYTQFVSDLDSMICITFAATDLYIEGGAARRQDIDNSSLDEEDLMDSVTGSNKEISKATYGGKEYFKLKYTTTSVEDGIIYDATVTNLIFCENGYMYMYQFSGDENNIYFKDFESLLSSAIYPEVEKDSILSSPIFSIILDLIITVAVYSLPVIAFRYLIKRKPVSPKTAKIITIAYGVVAFIIMYLIIATVRGGAVAATAIIFWGKINYIILTNGYEETVPKTHE